MLTKNPEKEFVFIRFDIVRFKLINSYFGHDEGDKVMKFIANTLKEVLKIYKLSSYGRIEADIFGICLNCNRDHHEKLIKPVSYTHLSS